MGEGIEKRNFPIKGEGIQERNSPIRGQNILKVTTINSLYNIHSIETMCNFKTKSGEESV